MSSKRPAVPGSVEQRDWMEKHVSRKSQYFSSVDWKTILENRKHFLSNPDFQKDLLEYRKIYPQSYWLREWRRVKGDSDPWETASWAAKYDHSDDVFQNAKYDAGEVCSDWGLDADHDYSWIEWLAQNWNPGKEPFPSRLEPEDLIPRSFFPWDLHSQRLLFHKPDQVTLILRPGVSYRSALRGLREALRTLENGMGYEPPPYPLTRTKRRGRPRLSEYESQRLNTILANCAGKPNITIKQIVNEAAKKMKAYGYSPSPSTISARLRELRKSNPSFRPVKQYLTKKRDIDPS